LLSEKEEGWVKVDGNHKKIVSSLANGPKDLRQDLCGEISPGIQLMEKKAS
jgi:hypothetical protein